MQSSIPPLVGREKELATLKTRVNRAFQGRGGLVFLRGEAGVGKTRLVNELKKYCESSGILFLSGKCDSPTIPYSPWIEAVNEFLRKSSPQKIRSVCIGPAVEIVALVPTLSSIIGPHEREMGLKDWIKGPKPSFEEHPASALAAAVQDESGRIRFFEGITQFFLNISKETPLLISLEDLHRADKVTIQLLRYLTRHIFDDRLLVIGSYRQEEIDTSHPLWNLVADLEKEVLSQTLALEALPWEATLEFVRHTVADAELSRQIASVVHNATRGNPYFMLETLRSLTEQGVIGKDHMDHMKLASITLPLTVRVLMRQRLDRLDQECVELLTVASVIGLEFDHELLLDVVGLPEDKLVNHLETALKEGLVYERKIGTSYLLGFVDARIRSILLEDIRSIRKRRSHEKIGETMEKIYARNRTEHLAQIALHYVEAANVEKAIEYSMLAGARAASTHAYDEAIRHYRNVVDLGEDLPEAKDALVKIQGLQKSIGGWNRALEMAADILYSKGWNRIPEFYEKNIVPMFKPLAEKVVEMAHLREGERILDIGTGTGLAAFLAADLTGSKGSVVGIDLSEGMLSVAKKKREVFRYKNIEFHRMDETALDLPDNSFDVVISDLGLAIFNTDLAFGEMYDVVKPGGRIAFNEWTERSSKAEDLFEEIMIKNRTPSPSEFLVAAREARTYRIRGFERLTDKAVLTKMLRDVGFKEVSGATIHHQVGLSTVEDYLTLEQSWWTIAAEVAEMTPENRQKFFGEVKEALTPLLTASGLILDWELNYFTAKK